MSRFLFGSKSSTDSGATTPSTKSTFSTKSSKTKDTSDSSSTTTPDSASTKSSKPTTTRIQTEPEPETKVAPIFEYDEKQKQFMKDVKEYSISISLPATDPYAKWERRWLNKPDTIPRYSRASKWNMNDAKKRMKGTMEWRREFKPELITPEEIKIEDVSGKILINGFDKDGRPIIYMRPGRQNTETSPRQLKHLVWCLERAKDLMPPGQESLVIIVDYKTTTLRTNPSVSVASKVLTILQQHYVETLGRAIVTNLPLLLNFFYKGISPFLDPITRDKMRFNPDLLELIPAAQLEAEFGGDYAYEFDHEAYWQQIIETCGIAPDGTRVNEVVPELDTGAGASSPAATESETKEAAAKTEETQAPEPSSDLVSDAKEVDTANTDAAEATPKVPNATTNATLTDAGQPTHDAANELVVSEKLKEVSISTPAVPQATAE